MTPRPWTLGLAALLISAPALAVNAPPGWNAKARTPQKGGEPSQMRPAYPLEKLPASSLNMRVGEKRSFKPVDSAGCSDPKVLKCQAENGILTVYARRAGRAIIIPLGARPSKGPPHLIQTLVTE